MLYNYLSIATRSEYVPPTRMHLAKLQKGPCTNVLLAAAPMEKTVARGLPGTASLKFCDDVQRRAEPFRLRSPRSRCNPQHDRRADVAAGTAAAGGAVIIAVVAATARCNERARQAAQHKRRVVERAVDSRCDLAAARGDASGTRNWCETRLARPVHVQYSILGQAAATSGRPARGESTVLFCTVHFCAG
jgi:hypothetical protein